MWIGASVLLVAAGAILRFALGAPAPGTYPATVGPVLMMLGALGLVVTGASMSVRRPMTDVEPDDTGDVASRLVRR